MNKRKQLATILASASAPQTTSPWSASGRPMFAVQLSYGTGTATTAKLQSSNNGSNWDDVVGSTVTLLTGGGSQTWNVVDFNSQLCRLVITGDSLTNVATLSAV